ncbi:MAG TPA: hypothetical protein VLC53_09050, partial [Myxococcota bacterium]|nr:hypothetical protein [Myxococcota bacterium]
MSAGSLSAGRLPGSRALLWIGGLAAALVAARAALRGLHVPEGLVADQRVDQGQLDQQERRQPEDPAAVPEVLGAQIAALQ